MTEEREPEASPAATDRDPGGFLDELEAEGSEIGAREIEGLVVLLGHGVARIRRRSAELLSLAATSRSQSLLERALDDRDALRRWGAAFALSQRGFFSTRLGEILVEALASEDVDRRWAATRLICAVAPLHKGFCSRVVELASDGSFAARKMALYCLREMGEVGCEPFLGALGDRRPEVRLAALAGLRRRGSGATRCVCAVLERFESDPHDGVRRAAVALLGELLAAGARSPEALEALRRASQESDDPSVVRAALRGLGLHARARGRRG